MEEIKAIIQPFMLDDVLRALAAIDDLPGVTVSEIQGWGRSRAVSAGDRRTTESGHALARKTKIETVVPSAMVSRVVDAIRDAAHTGNPGDGKIFVHSISEVTRIRTGETGEKAI